MSKVKIQGNASGTGIFTVAAPATNTDRTITLPDVDATVLTTAGGVVTSSLEVQASWRLGTNTGGSGSGAPYAGGVGGGFNPNNNIYSVYFRDRTDTYWNDAWLEAKTITLKSGGGAYNAIQCDASGRVIKSYQPSFKAGRSGTQSLAGGGTIIFNTTSSVGGHNIGNHYNTSTGQFTAPIAGRYMFSWMMLAEGVSSGTMFEFNLSVNGNSAAYSRRMYASSGTTMQGGYYSDSNHGIIVQLQANDVVYVREGWGTSSTIHGNADFTYFCGTLLG